MLGKKPIAYDPQYNIKQLQLFGKKNHLTDFDAPIEIGGDDLAGLGSFIEFLLNLLVVFSLFSLDFGFLNLDFFLGGPGFPHGPQTSRHP